MLSPGDKFKDYEVIAPLRSGGMAMLYLARRRGVGGFSRLVALKLVHQHLVEDETVIRLFLDEARISANVAHPNVVHVEEVGQTGGSYFIAMEYVHGVSLAELLAKLTDRRLRMSGKLCVWIAAQIAEALHAAHEATGESGLPLQIVHRDVSPQNVLIGHNGHVKLIDFGIAKSHASSHHLGHGRAVLGKLGYMSPEQLRLERADRRTDVYALGVMLWEMLTSRSLLRCQRIDDERDWATRESPPPPSKYSPTATAALDRVVLKALAYDPKERYDNAFEFRTALLRAEPSAPQLDAPIVAALMRSVLGDELERRRANWPTEVSAELDVGESVTGSQTWSLDELTADIGSGNTPSFPEEDDDEPTTLAASPMAMRGAHSNPESGEIAEAARRTPRPDFSLSRAEAEASIIVSASTHVTHGEAVLGNAFVTQAQRAVLIDQGKLTVRPMAVGALCLMLGLLLGTMLTGSNPEAEAKPDSRPEPPRSEFSEQRISLTARVEPAVHTLPTGRERELPAARREREDEPAANAAGAQSTESAARSEAAEPTPREPVVASSHSSRRRLAKASRTSSSGSGRSKSSGSRSRNRAVR